MVLVENPFKRGSEGGAIYERPQTAAAPLLSSLGKHAILLGNKLAPATSSLEMFLSVKKKVREALVERLMKDC